MSSVNGKVINIQSGQNPFIYLNTFQMGSIFRKLELKDLGNLAQVCKQFYAFFKEENFWRALFLRDFGEKYLPQKKVREGYLSFSRQFQEMWLANNVNTFHVFGSVLLKEETIIKNGKSEVCEEDEWMASQKYAIKEFGDPSENTKVTFGSRICVTHAFICILNEKFLKICDHNYGFCGSYSFRYDWPSQIPSPVFEVGHWLVAVSTGAVKFFDARNISPSTIRTWALRDENQGITSILVLNQSLYVLFGTEIYRYDLVTHHVGMSAYNPEVKELLATASVFSSDYLLASNVSGQELLLYRTSDLSNPEKILELNVSEIGQLNVQGRHLYVAFRTSFLNIYDLDKMTTLNTIDLRIGEFHSFVVYNDHLISAGNKGIKVLAFGENKVLDDVSEKMSYLSFSEEDVKAKRALSKMAILGSQLILFRENQTESDSKKLQTFKASKLLKRNKEYQLPHNVETFHGINSEVLVIKRKTHDVSIVTIKNLALNTKWVTKECKGYFIDRSFVYIKFGDLLFSHSHSGSTHIFALEGNELSTFTNPILETAKKILIVTKKAVLIYKNAYSGKTDRCEKEIFYENEIVSAVLLEDRAYLMLNDHKIGKIDINTSKPSMVDFISLSPKILEREGPISSPQKLLGTTSFSLGHFLIASASGGKELQFYREESSNKIKYNFNLKFDHPVTQLVADKDRIYALLADDRLMIGNVLFPSAFKNFKYKDQPLTSFVFYQNYLIAQSNQELKVIGCNSLAEDAVKSGRLTNFAFTTKDNEKHRMISKIQVMDSHLITFLKCSENHGKENPFCNKIRVIDLEKALFS